MKYEFDDEENKKKRIIKKAEIMCKVNIYIYKIVTAAFNYCVQLKHNHVIIVLMNFLLEV